MADGQRLVKGVINIKERHLKAEPKLPNLEERAAMSSNKSLYKLSQKLAEISEDDNENIYYYILYTLILHVVIFGYLIYILFVDVNEYLNEERRYLAKMETAVLPLKLVYFLLRLLRVRIF
ncbi:uncharacterized protein Dwil_GK22043 [Drosophila willistoni]|uniref:Uncharacterized protein n=1 Tax=Drosophila willistoni TaxID=7260 RepID=A0A0Q9WSR4_DROWI|nr:uncharacterized protein Dwil_GK22043 [Drosophila willistoni]